MFANDLLNILACPACNGELNTDCNRTELLCRICGTVFPVSNDIPVLLPDAAPKDNGPSGNQHTR